MPPNAAVPDRMHRIDYAALAPVRECRAAPIGNHSADLMAMPSGLRFGDVAGKYCLVGIQPHAAWAIARLSERRGEPPTIPQNHMFDGIDPAEWATPFRPPTPKESP